MSTSDQRGPLTRKQLREIRLTGSTPVITEEQAEAAAEAANATPPAAPLPRAAEPAPVAPAPVADSAVDLGAAPLTRRQAREQEKIKTASVPVVGADAAEDDRDTAPRAEESDDDSSIVSGIPDFSSPSAPVVDEVDDDDDVDDEVSIEPVSAADAVESAGSVPLAEPAEPEPVDVAELLGVPGTAEADEVETGSTDERDDLLADQDDDRGEVADGERPTVSPAFGEGVLAAEEPAKPASFRPSFDELLTSNDSGGSHRSPNALIFTPSPGEGSLSGPVASTGEILITGSYELPKGIGSQGHAHGTADGKDVDAVLIDGELPPASSPTPIAASSAVSTIKPAGEVIRPPAPEKGNRLMLILAIVAGGLALALGVALVVAFTTNVF
ncbi:hypothetical protein ACFV3I_11895 [Microbacterium sp. NPDC059771]|uniref:hypothetical protein n=1 Tax=Microbacterium sp. NPDC059771 TaxID=3346941 RepID=UPI00365226C2